MTDSHCGAHECNPSSRPDLSDGHGALNDAGVTRVVMSSYMLSTMTLSTSGVICNDDGYC